MMSAQRLGSANGIARGAAGPAVRADGLSGNETGGSASETVWPKLVRALTKLGVGPEREDDAQEVVLVLLGRLGQGFGDCMVHSKRSLP